MNKEINWTTIVIGVLIILIVILIGYGVLYSVEKSKLNILCSYEEELLNQYSNNGKFVDDLEAAEFLDLLETYISDNQRNLMIKKYTRSSHRIVIDFYSGSWVTIRAKVKDMK